MQKVKVSVAFIVLATLLISPHVQEKTLASFNNIHEFEITKGASVAGSSSISGNIVVWTDNRNGNLDIYGSDLTMPPPKREFPITVGSGDQLNADISGNIVVWQNNAIKPISIFAKNLSTGKEFAVSPSPANQVLPAISGNIIVWTDYRNETGGCCNGDIFGYNLSTGTEFPISTNLSHQVFPDVAGNKVIWIDNRNTVNPSLPEWDIYSYDLMTNTETRITPVSFNQSFLPKVSEKAIAWVVGNNLYEYEFATQKTSIIASGFVDSPNISNNIIVWRDGRNFSTTKGDIYGFDLVTRQEFLISNRSSDQYSPNVDSTPLGNGVVWRDIMSGANEIWGAFFQ